ncbi:hypothetical protein Syun_010773 [Stephania yunnanensis]|uniref:Uncharacterized protein n=1 Tax=Stephania yunnanensis TaxID=152371 RepID=A0AAP0KIW6_9MAGN
MGSDRKSKKKRSFSPAITGSEGEDRITKKQEKSRSRDDGKERKRSSSDGKREKKSESEKRSHERSKRHKHRSHKGDKSEDKHDHKRRKQSEFQELSSDDYFSKSNEFATWLKEERGVYFSDLTSESARELFLGFIKDWNAQKLESRYYKGIATGPRTAHNWKFRTEK